MPESLTTSLDFRSGAETLFVKKGSRSTPRAQVKSLKIIVHGAPITRVTGGTNRDDTVHPYVSINPVTINISRSMVHPRLEIQRGGVRSGLLPRQSEDVIKSSTVGVVSPRVAAAQVTEDQAF